MIISASRRTDIPAFHTDWFFERLRAGYAEVANPMNPRQIKRVSLAPDYVDCFVFWTKDISPMLPRLSELCGYDYYVQYTLNAYGTDVEPCVPSLEMSIAAFQELSEKVGPDRVIWRYDPILLNAVYTPQFHIENYAYIARALNGRAHVSTISFIDYYRRIAKNWRALGITEPAEDDIAIIARSLAATARENGMEIRACAEKHPLA